MPFSLPSALLNTRSPHISVVLARFLSSNQTPVFPCLLHPSISSLGLSLSPFSSWCPFLLRSVRIASESVGLIHPHLPPRFAFPCRRPFLGIPISPVVSVFSPPPNRTQVDESASSFCVTRHCLLSLSPSLVLMDHPNSPLARGFDTTHGAGYYDGLKGNVWRLYM